jgi:hypothetical protein
MRVLRDAGQSRNGEMAYPDRYQAMLNQLGILSPDFMSPDFNIISLETDQGGRYPLDSSIVSTKLNIKEKPSLLFTNGAWNDFLYSLTAAKGASSC